MNGQVIATYAGAVGGYVWALIKDSSTGTTTWYQLSSDGGEGSVTDMFTQLVAARGTGATVTVGLTSSTPKKITYVLY